MHTQHVAIWLDHNEARIFHVTAGTFEESTIHSPQAHVQLHRKAGSDDGHRVLEDQTYYHDIARSLSDAEQILVMGPANAKHELMRHIHKHHHLDLEPKIIGVESVDHPTDGQFVAQVRRYFRATGRMG